ncbi:MAG: hypothetical protein EOO65_01160 [Methanosarcinales archaeon]|nr:MAG: hypothetical protein EOO65_01160 [Methanosarcinales archaeon]
MSARLDSVPPVPDALTEAFRFKPYASGRGVEAVKDGGLFGEIEQNDAGGSSQVVHTSAANGERSTWELSATSSNHLRHEESDAHSKHQGTPSPAATDDLHSPAVRDTTENEVHQLVAHQNAVQLPTASTEDNMDSDTPSAFRVASRQSLSSLRSHASSTTGSGLSLQPSLELQDSTRR